MLRSYDIYCYISYIQSGWNKKSHCGRKTVRGLFVHRLIAWISNYIHHKLCDEIIHPFPNFNGATEGCEWINNLIPHLTGQLRYRSIVTRRSENNDTPQPLDQWTNSPFMGQQVGNWSICHALWPKRKPIVHPTLYVSKCIYTFQYSLYE